MLLDYVDLVERIAAVKLQENMTRQAVGAEDWIGLMRKTSCSTVTPEVVRVTSGSVESVFNGKKLRRPPCISFRKPMISCRLTGETKSGTVSGLHPTRGLSWYSTCGRLVQGEAQVPGAVCFSC